MLRRAYRHALVLAVVFVWFLPAAAALGVTLHVALDHEGDGANPELLLGVVHGHVHLDGEGDHRHDATGPRYLKAPKPGGATLPAVAAGLRSGALAWCWSPDQPAHASRGSPLHLRLCVFLL